MDVSTTVPQLTQELAEWFADVLNDLAGDDYWAEATLRDEKGDYGRDSHVAGELVIWRHGHKTLRAMFPRPPPPPPPPPLCFEPHPTRTFGACLEPKGHDGAHAFGPVGFRTQWEHR